MTIVWRWERQVLHISIDGVELLTSDNFGYLDEMNFRTKRKLKQLNQIVIVKTKCYALSSMLCIIFSFTI